MSDVHDAKALERLASEAAAAEPGTAFDRMRLAQAAQQGLQRKAAADEKRAQEARDHERAAVLAQEDAERAALRSKRRAAALGLGSKLKRIAAVHETADGSTVCIYTGILDTGCRTDTYTGKMPKTLK